ncbi:MAG: hypothetical protein RLZZ11_1834 [Cyanobacteriota bacterium]|jgi:hypothetical protein
MSLPLQNDNLTAFDSGSPAGLDWDDAVDQSMISRQRQRYLASLLSGQEAKSDNQYREQ